MFLIIILCFISRSSSFLYPFTANQNYLLIEIYSQEYKQLTITIYKNDSLQMSVKSADYDIYLSSYYKLEVGVEYQLDIRMNGDNYLISQQDSKGCAAQCTNQGGCIGIECQCFDNYLGDRCQYRVQQNYDKNQLWLDFKSYEMQIIAIYYLQTELLDDQGQIKTFTISSSSLLSTSIYLLLPFEYPSTQLNEDRRIFNGVILQSQQIPLTPVFQPYHIKQATYTILLKLQSPIDSSIQLQFSIHSEDSQFQDFILVAILSVVAFIIFLIIVYVVRRRCQYISANQMKSKSEVNSGRSLVMNMQVVVPVKDVECIICLDLLESQTCRQTPCKHVMHENCLIEWSLKQETCPICRESLNDEELLPRTLKLRNQPTTLVGYSGIMMQSERNSVRSMILQRSRQSRLAVFQ